MTHDPISDMLVAIRNAGVVGHEEVSVPHSKLKETILAVLKEEKFIKDFAKGTSKGKPVLKIELIIEDRIPRVKGTKRLSKPSKRIYKRATDIRPVKSGYGLMVLSTPKGVMSGRTAKREKVGGEALFSIW